MTTKLIKKNYNQTKSKLRTSFEDIQYLIALHLELLEKIRLLDEKVKMLWNSISTF